MSGAGIAGHPNHRGRRIQILKKPNLLIIPVSLCLERLSKICSVSAGGFNIHNFGTLVHTIVFWFFNIILSPAAGS